MPLLAALIGVGAPPARAAEPGEPSKGGPAFEAAEEVATAVEDYERVDVTAFPLAGYTPETSWVLAGLGLLLVRPPQQRRETGKTSSVIAAATYTLNQQWLVNLSPNVYLADGDYNLKASVALMEWPDTFFGVGNDTRRADEQRYDSRNWGARLKAGRRVGADDLYAYAIYHFSTRTVEPRDPGMLADDAVVGANGGLQSGVGVGVTWDGRDSGFAATEGWYLEGELKVYDAAFGSDFEFSRLELDARRYFMPVAGHVVAAQLRWESNLGDEVPFWMLSKLGGSSKLRGIFQGRYRDRHLAVVQAEYRTPPLWRFRLVSFGGVGRVFPEVDEVTLTQLRWSAGGGLRFAVDEDEGVNLRLDYGVGPDGDDGVYLSFGEAF